MKIKILKVTVLIAICGTLNATINRYENENIISYKEEKASRGSIQYTHAFFLKKGETYCWEAGTGDISTNYDIRSIGAMPETEAKKVFDELKKSYYAQEEKKPKKLMMIKKR